MLIGILYTPNMKFIKKFLIGLVLFIGIAIAAMYIFNVDYLLKAIRIVYFNGHSTAFLDDYKYFDNRKIPKSNNPQPWPVSKEYNKAKPTERLENLHNRIGTVAFLIIKNDSILSESYYDDYNNNSRSNSFSMAKSVVSAALGKAIKEGKIKKKHYGIKTGVYKIWRPCTFWNRARWCSIVFSYSCK